MLSALSKALRAFAEKDGRGYPDWAARYVPIVRRLRRHDLGDGPILEIGANENGLSRFAGIHVFALDLERDHLIAAREHQSVTPIVGDIRHLPIRSGVIDVCVCVDTFEHLPESVRADSVQEIKRVLGPQGTAVVAFPSGEAAAQAETTIREEYRACSGNDLRWLREHEENGLPDAADVLRDMESVVGPTHRVTQDKNLNVNVWRWMWRILLCEWPGRGNAMFQVALRLATPIVCRLHMGTCYRTIIWVEPKQRG